MTDTIISGPQSTQLTIDENDTLGVTPLGSLVVSGSDAVVWDLGPSSAVPPGVVIVNDGLIESLTGGAIDTTGDGGGNARSISLTNHGTITSPGDAIRIDNGLVDGVVLIDNSGTISATGSGQAIDFDSVESAASIVITNRATGHIHAAAADAVRPGAGATFHNYGHVEAEGGGDGIDFRDDAGGTVYNYAGGLIEGSKHGITGDEAVTVFNALGGEIIGHNGSAVNIDNGSAVENTVFVTNYGTMEGRSAETSDSDGDAVDTDGLLVLENYGTIEGLGHEGYKDGEPNISEGVAMGGGIINNYEGAVIYGYGRAIQADNSSNGGAFSATEITNDGLIEGAGNGPEGVDPEDILPLTPIGSEAINLVGDWADTITNNGAIIGGVKMGGGSDTLTNRGTMEALNGSAIDLGAGDDDLILYTGSSVDGAIIGGDGELDFLNLLMEEDSESDTGTIAEVSGFELLAVGGGSWTVLDTQVYGAGVEIVAGAELVLGDGGSAGALGGKVVTYGNFAVNRSDVFTLDNLVDGGGSLEQRGTGTTVIATANTFSGGTLITDGVLQLSAEGAVGSGAVVFDELGGESLVIDDAALTDAAFANDVLGLGEDDAVAFTGLAFFAGTQVDYDEATGLVEVIGKYETYSFTLLAPESSELVAVSDGAGGTAVMLRDVGVEIRGTGKANLIDGQHTVLGQVLPTDADDKINGRNGDDRIDGLAGNDTVIGGNGDDVLAGGSGDDWLYGRADSNKLIGGAGMDAFVFDAKLGAGNAGKGSGDAFSFAKMKDFAIGEDQILLDRKVFKALDKGALSGDAFAMGKKAKAEGVHILYKDGAIRYDADGKGGKDAVLFAKVDKSLAIGADDFLVI